MVGAFLGGGFFGTIGDRVGGVVGLVLGLAAAWRSH